MAIDKQALLEYLELQKKSRTTMPGHLTEYFNPQVIMLDEIIRMVKSNEFDKKYDYVEEIAAFHPGMAFAKAGFWSSAPSAETKEIYRIIPDSESSVEVKSSADENKEDFPSFKAIHT